MKTPPPAMAPNTDGQLETLVEDYLDGMLSAAETRAFEARLMEPGVQGLLAEALALRSLLTELPADAIPEGLVDRIENALGVAETTNQRFPRLRAALAGAAWALRGPSHATSGDELAPLSLAATPVSMLMPKREQRPLWRRVLGFGSAT